MLFTVNASATGSVSPKITESAVPGGPLGFQFPAVAQRSSAPVAPVHSKDTANDLDTDNIPRTNNTVILRRLMAVQFGRARLLTSRLARTLAPPKMRSEEHTSELQS